MSDTLRPHGQSASRFPVLHFPSEFAQTLVHWVNDATQPLPPLSPPSPPAFNLSQHQGLSNELALHIRWPKYSSFSFSISPSNEYSGMISFRIDWFGLCSLRDSQESSPASQLETVKLYKCYLVFTPACQPRVIILSDYTNIIPFLHTGGLRYRKINLLRSINSRAGRYHPALLSTC